MADDLVLMQVQAVIDERTTVICLHAAGMIEPVGPGAYESVGADMAADQVADSVAVARQQEANGLIPIPVEDDVAAAVDGLTGDEAAKMLADLRWNPYSEKYEFDAFSTYQGQGYADINRWLRSGGAKGQKITLADGRTVRISQVVEQMTYTINSAPPTTNTMTVWRGVNYLPEDVGVGSVFEELGFTSTSIRQEAALSSAARRADYLLQVEVPEGSQVFAMNTSDWPSEEGMTLPIYDAGGIMRGEAEVLLAPGSRHVVTGIETTTIDGRDYQVVKVRYEG